MFLKTILLTLYLLLQLKNLSVNEAMAQMAFSPSSRGSYATTALKRAVRQAEIYHNLPQVCSTFSFTSYATW